ncbi:class I SAM-dependent methyltransferase [Shewanella putrefaciens]|uniref:class I SAM-dependent methyltransferase n=1 Tax=Shewanella putrefaciens TaxID=24 RepID=UPI0021BF4EE3|nr:class I SAM-dependent methyltransferase [Shewanella putrefaciens]UXK07265.1 class I SAM-dependent methyltransferase [Shewanella putrefaciens]
MEQWTNYWQQTRALNSFAEGQSALGYHGDLQHFWYKQIDSLPSVANILDIGTGNGALAVLCHQYGFSRSAQWDITAIDAADIKPHLNYYSEKSINNAIKSIHFWGNTNIESSPFEGHKFDFLCSQFALEYSNLSLSLLECIRLLKPNGKLCAVMHSENSDIVLDSQAGLVILNLFLSESDVLVRIKNLLELAEKIISQGMVLNECSEFNLLNKSVLQEVVLLQQSQSGHFRYWFDRIISAIAPLLYELKLGNATIFLNYIKELGYYRERLTDQLNAIVNDDRKKEVDAILISLGVEYYWSSLEVENKKFGCVLELYNSVQC